MKKFLQTVLATSLLFIGVANATNLKLDKKPKRSDKTAVIVVFDIVSLNHPAQSPLFQQNLNQYKIDFTKKSFQKLKVKKIEYFIMGKTVHSSAIVKNRKSKRVYRDSMKAIEKVKDEIKLIDTKKVGKDIVSTIEYINSIIDEQYQDFDHVLTVFYSNFRNTVNNKKLKKLKSIELNPKVEKMIVFANSGLQHTNNISSSQILKASKNTKKFFLNKLPNDKLVWISNY